MSHRISGIFLCLHLRVKNRDDLYLLVWQLFTQTELLINKKKQFKKMKSSLYRTVDINVTWSKRREWMYISREWENKGKTHYISMYNTHDICLDVCSLGVVELWMDQKGFMKQFTINYSNNKKTFAPRQSTRIEKDTKKKINKKILELRKFS